MSTMSRRQLIPSLAMLATSGLAGRALARSAPGPLFTQPTYTDGIAPHFSVTDAAPAYNPVGAFYLHANQPNPHRRDNAFVPVGWSAGHFTGLSVAGDPSMCQRGIVTAADPTGYGHTIAQIEGEAVGGFIRSDDLINGSPHNRMMVAPLYTFAAPPTPFSRTGGSLRVKLDLQVPTAADFHVPKVSNSYAKIDLLFVCAPTGARLSVSCGLFVNGSNPTVEKTSYDTATSTVLIFAQAQTASRRLTLRPGSTTLQSKAWRGWRNFDFTISAAQLASGLADALIVAQSYGSTLSTNPADYALSQTHLNAELHYTPTMPAMLGWSMRRLSITETS